MKTLMILFFGLSFGMVSAQADSDTLKIKTSAVSEMCKERIEHDMKFEKGVSSAELDLKSAVLTLVYNPAKTTEEKLKTAVTKIGYSADDMPANEKAYSKLPGCCQKAGACNH